MLLPLGSFAKLHLGFCLLGGGVFFFRHLGVFVYARLRLLLLKFGCF